MESKALEDGKKKNRWKKIILGCEIGLVLLFLVVIFFMDSSYALSDFAEEGSLGDGVKNIYLTYINSETSLTEDNLVPLLYYKYQDGTVSNETFMDTFLILPTSSYNSAFWNRTFSADEWQDYVDLEYANLKTLNDVVSTYNSLHGTNQKVKIILSTFYQEDPTFASSSNEAVKQMVDDQLTMIAYSYFDYLELVGFYWDKESVTSSAQEDTMKYFNQYVQGQGYKTIWVPYIDNYNGNSDGSNGYDGKTHLYRQGYSYGFDLVSLQSGYYFKGNTEAFVNFNGAERLPYANTEASTYHMAVEVEMDSSYFENRDNFDRYLEYLQAGVQNGWNQSINVYYATALAKAGNSSSSFYYDIYDLTYQYAKESLALSSINLSYYDGYSTNYENVSQGKSYTLDATPVTESTTKDHYSNVAGDELTDGERSKGGWGSSWLGFKGQDQYEVVVDLGKNYSSLSYFDVEVEDDSGSGIGLPPEIQVYASTDNVTFQWLGNATYLENEHVMVRLAVLDLDTPVSARYVKFVVSKNPSHTFTFLSEVTVGRTATISLAKTSGQVAVANGPITIDIATDNAGTLSATSSDPSVATATIEDDELVVTPVAAGTATITVTEAKYSRSATYRLDVLSADISSIYVSSLPNKTSYVQNYETLDLTGGTITVDFVDNTSKIVNMNNSSVTVTGFDNSEVGTQEITVNYGGYSTTFEVEIVARSIAGISIATLPSNLKYIQDTGNLSLAGGVLKVQYTDGSSEELSMVDPLVQATGFDNTTPGENTVTLTYQGYTTTFTVEIIDATSSTVIPVTSVELGQETLELAVGETETLTVTVLPTNATDKSVSWQSSNLGIATVDANGQVTAIAPGTVTVTVTSNDGLVKDEVTITVTDEESGLPSPTDPSRDPSSNDQTAIEEEVQIGDVPNTGTTKNVLLTIIGLAIIALGVVYYKKFAF